MCDHIVSSRQQARDGSDEEKADILGKYFASVFTAEGNNDDYNKHPSKTSKYPCPNLNISKEKIFDKLKDLNISKSPGPDLIQSKILWEIRDEIVHPLRIIFETSFRLGILPQEWRSANITAIHKKGNKNQPSNYRPISLTSIICKIMESIVRDEIP